MPIFAIHNGSVISNVIVADTIELAEQVTGMEAIESVDGVPAIGWLLVNGEWVAPPQTGAVHVESAADEQIGGPA